MPSNTTKHLIQILQSNYHGTDRATINRIVDCIKHLDTEIQALHERVAVLEDKHDNG